MKNIVYLFLASCSLAACGRVEVSDATSASVAEACTKMGKEPDFQFSPNGAILKCKEAPAKPPLPSSSN